MSTTPSPDPDSDELPTVPATVYKFPLGDFDRYTWNHPALACLERHLREAVEPHRWNVNPEDEEVEAHTFLITPAGPLADGAVDAYKILAKAHEKYSAIYHEFDYVVVYDTDWGYKMVGTATFYYISREFLFSGESSRVRSRNGKFWEGRCRGAYVVCFKDHGGRDVQVEGWEIFNSYLTNEEWEKADDESGLDD